MSESTKSLTQGWSYLRHPIENEMSVIVGVGGIVMWVLGLISFGLIPAISAREEPVAHASQIGFFLSCVCGVGLIGWMVIEIYDWFKGILEREVLEEEMGLTAFRHGESGDQLSEEGKSFVPTPSPPLDASPKKGEQSPSEKTGEDTQMDRRESDADGYRGRFDSFRGQTSFRRGDGVDDRQKGKSVKESGSTGHGLGGKKHE